MAKIKNIVGHPNVLLPAAQKIINNLKDILPKSFYLAGGTALALQLGHRISIDFDFFSASPFDSADRTHLIQKLKKFQKFERIENKASTLHVRLNNIHCSFFHYPYKLLYTPLRWQGIRLAQCEDIAPMKLNAIIGRGSKKDFIDVFMIAKRLGLKKIFALSMKKFSDYPSFPLQAARALVYFQDADSEPMPRMLTRISWKEIKQYLERETKKSVRSLLNQTS